MYLIKNTLIFLSIIAVCNVLQCNLFLWWKAEFSASLLRSLVSHNPSEIILICWLAAEETYLIIMNMKNSCAAYNIFVETGIKNFMIFWIESSE